MMHFDWGSWWVTLRHLRYSAASDDATIQSRSRPGKARKTFRGAEALEPRILLDAAPTFEVALEDQFLPIDGTALTIGIDAFDADGDPLTITAVSDDPDIDLFIPTGNRFARMVFVESDGETRIPIAAMLSFSQTRKRRHERRICRFVLDRYDGANNKLARALLNRAHRAHDIVRQVHHVTGCDFQIPGNPVVEDDLIVGHVRREKF